MYAVTEKGELAWSADLGHDVDGTPAVDDDGAVYVGTDGNEVVRLGDDGQIVWATPVGGYVRGALSVARNGDVLAGVYGPSPRLVRLSSGGSLLGAFAVPGSGAPESGVHGAALEDVDGALLFGGQDGAVYAIGADGTERWRVPTASDIDSPVTLLEDGTVLAGCYDGTVYALGERISNAGIDEVTAGTK